MLIAATCQHLQTKIQWTICKSTYTSLKKYVQSNDMHTNNTTIIFTVYDTEHYFYVLFFFEKILHKRSKIAVEQKLEGMKMDE